MTRKEYELKLKEGLLSLALLFAPISAAAASSLEAVITAAIQAEKKGNHEEALRLFTEAANQGDAKAMTSVGLMHQAGRGTRADACAALEWFKKAMLANDTDALNNIGVMFRDGECVTRNRKVAYLTFLFIHMNMLGSESTQMRSNRNLRREMAELKTKEIEEALCYTFPYYRAMLMSGGKSTEAPEQFLPTDQNPSFKDARWWSREERESMKFSCPAPWGAGT